MRAAHYFCISALVLAPCFRHSRIQAGDLSSHIYNAWLALELEHRPVAGLAVVSQPTNILFDLILTGLLRKFGVDAAQRIAVSGCVLVFFWGSLAFLEELAKRPVRWLAPVVAMLSYGWIFHNGFFNFYLSFGLSMFGMVFWWRKWRVAALLLSGVAWTAHSLPVIWAIVSAGFLVAASRFPRYALVGALTSVVAVRLYLDRHFTVIWLPEQIANAIGFDQLNLFGNRYAVFLIALPVLCAALAARRIRLEGSKTFIASPDVQFLALLSLSMMIIPISVSVPGTRVLLAFLSNRLSVAVALLACVVAAKIPPPRWAIPTVWVLMATFGVFLYQDTGRFNRVEDAITAAVADVAPGQRVVLAAEPPQRGINLMVHMIDRACIGRCYSYANYEPSTLVFRVRATAANPVVVADYGESVALQSGRYKVSGKEPPLLQANVCPGEETVRITSLEAGQLAGLPVCRR